MRIFLIILVAGYITSCNNSKQEKKEDPSASDFVVMTTSATNTAKLGDTLVIYESVCRGCAYEQSTHFEFEDSAALLKLDKITTIDNTPADVNGGSIDKHLYFIPQKAGRTRLKLYKFKDMQPKAADSLMYDVYNIEIKN